MRLLHLTLILAVFAISACEQKSLQQLRKAGDGPDEFLITPGKPLQPPESFTSLPAPTPGGANLTDLQPLQDSVAALGGTRRPASSAIPARDGGIVNYASRLGRDGSIRQTLATEDAVIRKRGGRLLSLRFRKQDNYNLVYQRQTLDAARENRRWRRAGARTPSAPPS